MSIWGKDKPQPTPREVKLSALRDRLRDLDAQILVLAEKDVLTEDEELRWEELTAERETIAPEYEKLEERAERAEQIRKKTYRELRGLPEVRRPVEEYYGRDVRKMDWREARDGALKILEDRDQNSILESHQMDLLDKKIRNDSDLARRIIVTENEHYRNAFHKKMLRGEYAVLTSDEQIAMLRYDEYRAQAEGSTSAGGFAIPVFIDPSIILTDQETDNPFLTLAKQVTVNTNAWKGVSAAGMTWSFDDEAEEVSDDAVGISQPSVTVHSARGFIPYSYEIGEDWPGFQAEMARLLAEGYDELLIDKFTKGSGNGEPRGLITALTANTNSQVLVTTSGAFSEEDVYKLWSALPQKYRRKASWMMNVGVNNQIRRMGVYPNSHASTVDLKEGAAAVLFGRQVYENPYMDDFTGTTGQAQLAVLGDFQNYVIARRTGMQVEIVPQLFGSNNRPTGQRGWFAHARIGGNVVNQAGFRVLVNT